MKYLATQQPSFKQVVAIDTNFEMFTRAWCVAELIAADTDSIRQSVVVHSNSNFDDHCDSLASLDIRQCQSTRAEDKEFVLSKVSNIEVFNERLRWLLFGTEGLFRAWIDAPCRAGRVGRIAGRALRKQKEVCTNALSSDTGV